MTKKLLNVIQRQFCTTLRHCIPVRLTYGMLCLEKSDLGADSQTSAVVCLSLLNVVLVPLFRTKRQNTANQHRFTEV